ncbi:MAG: universal stress protein [Cytophagales bacterium]
MKESYNISKILVPVDFSERSANAVVQSTTIAKSNGAKLLLYHAYSRPADIADLSNYEQEHRLNLKTEKVKEHFDVFVSNISELKNCDFEIIYELGISLQNIEKAFKNLEIDLMVLATHGAKGVELMWGSKTTNLINRLKGPILVIPDGSKIVKPKCFCLAYDFHKQGQNVYSLSTLKQLAMAFNTHIRIIDVRAHNYPKGEERIKEENKISNYLGNDVLHDFETVIGKDVEHELIKYVHEYEIDMLAVMPGEHSFFEKLFHQSISELMAAEIDIPLLTLVDK